MLHNTVVISTHRAGSAKERAAASMALIKNPDMNGLIPTIGGSNTASILPYLKVY